MEATCCDWIGIREVLLFDDCERVFNPRSCCPPSGSEPVRPRQIAGLRGPATYADPVGEVPAAQLRHCVWPTTWELAGCGWVSAGCVTVCRRDCTQWAAPRPSPPVLVTANYKLTLDHLRSQSKRAERVDSGAGHQGRECLVCGRQGDVWHRRARPPGNGDAADRDRIASATGAAAAGRPGVAAHEVKNRCGFRVVFGPVSARDIPAFLAAGMQATPAMRKVEFPLGSAAGCGPDRSQTATRSTSLPAAAALLLLAGLGADGYSWSRVAATGLISAASAARHLAGQFRVAAPALLPWLPGRPLSLKGLWLGLGLLCALAGGALGPARAEFDSSLGMVASVPAGPDGEQLHRR